MVSGQGITTKQHKKQMYLTWCVRGQPQTRVFRFIRLQSTSTNYDVVSIKLSEHNLKTLFRGLSQLGHKQEKTHTIPKVAQSVFAECPTCL